MKTLIQNKPFMIPPKIFLQAFYIDQHELFNISVINDKKPDTIINEYTTSLIDFDNLYQKELKRMISQGYSIYFTPNGIPEPDFDKTSRGNCNSVFVKINKRYSYEQLEKICNFALSPSIIVREGTSLYMYWLLSNGDRRRFKDIQIKLISWFDSEPITLNEAYLIKLPMITRNNQDANSATIIHFEPAKGYSMDEIENYISDNPKSKNPNVKEGGKDVIRKP